MKQYSIFLGLLFSVAFPLYAQNWTAQDSLQLQQLLSGEGEVKLNPDVLKEMGVDSPLGTPKALIDKSWLDFDTSLPVMPQMPEKKVVLTLRPYTANTKYNWDPVYQKKVKVNKDTWRNDPYRELTTRFIYSNWAKNPMDAGPRETIDQIEATGIRYRVTERVNGMAVARWQKAEGEGFAVDMMLPFTKDFWDFKGRKRRARTLEVLKSYGDSISARPPKAINQ